MSFERHPFSPGYGHQQQQQKKRTHTPKASHCTRVHVGVYTPYEAVINWRPLGFMRSAGVASVGATRHRRVLCADVVVSTATAVGRCWGWGWCEGHKREQQAIRLAFYLVYFVLSVGPVRVVLCRCFALIYFAPAVT
ncbi:hypothetical protein QTP88_008467 [Uroleucon formosanum]